MKATRRTIDIALGHNPYDCVTIRAYQLPHQLTDSQRKRVSTFLRGGDPAHAYDDLGRRLALIWEPDIYGDYRLTVDYPEDPRPESPEQAEARAKELAS